MSNEITTPWQGNWQERLNSKLQSLGHSSLREFFDSHPGVSYLVLAENLGDANIAAMQLYGEHLRQATEVNQLRAASIDCLCRLLVQHLKRGWGVGKHFPVRVASAFGDWKSIVSQFSNQSEADLSCLDAVTSALKGLNPPDGWVPVGPHDEFLTKAFDAGWPN